MTVLQLHKPAPCEEVVATLRRIADDIEAGEHGDWPVTTAVVVIGHTDAETNDGENRMQRAHWATYGAGPRADSFTVRGLLLTAVNDWASA